MILCAAAGDLRAADGAAGGGDDRPAVFAVDGNLLAVQIALQLRAVGGKLDPALKEFSYSHEELMVGLDVIFSHLADGHTAGKGGA